MAIWKSPFAEFGGIGMTIACGSLCFTTLPFDRTCAEIASMGFKAIDVAVMQGWAHFNPSDLVEGLESAITTARAALRAYELTPVAFNVSCGAGDLTHEPTRFRAVCEFAKALEVSILCYTAPIEVVGMERALRRYERLLPLAQEYDMILAVEAHARTMLEVPSVAVEFCESLPGLMLTLDPSHMYAGPQQGAPFEELYPYVRHTHWRDSGYDWEHVQMPVGQGKVDFGRILKGLRQAGYQGAYSVEYIDTFPNGTRQNVLAMKRMLTNALERDGR
jgi:sugar phosphate isomerase/epimerase